MDLDVTRSNQPTVRKRWYDALKNITKSLRWREADNRTINSGDSLSQTVYEVVSNSDFPDSVRNKCTQILSSALSKVVDGQVLDLDFSGKTDITMGKTLYMYGLKTGELFAACALMGLAVSNGTEEQAYHATRWAKEYFNYRFQIHDDFIENNIDGEKGKPVGRDIVEGKMTPLVIETLRRGDSGQKKTLLNAFRHSDASQQQIEVAIDAMHASGAVSELRAYKEKLAELGKAEIEMMGLVHPFDELLKDLTEYVGVRNF